MVCERCGKEAFMPFTCPYCKGSFCSEHRLPENHSCPKIELARFPQEDVQSEVLKVPKSFDYKIHYSPSGVVHRRAHFSSKELLHLFVAALLVVGVGVSLSWTTDFNSTFLAFSVVIFTGSFFIHEFAHKIVAQRKGIWAEFRLTVVGAALTLVSVFSLFKFISPGAVMIYGSADRKNMGEIAVAGPLTNLVLSVAFLIGLRFAPGYWSLLMWGMWFNAWISFFNLLPFWVFDGLKVFVWNKRTWALMFTASLSLTLYSYAIMFGL